MLCLCVELFQVSVIMTTDIFYIWNMPIWWLCQGFCVKYSIQYNLGAELLLLVMERELGTWYSALKERFTLGKENASLSFSTLPSSGLI